MSTINEKSVANMITDKKVYGPIYVDEALTWREIIRTQPEKVEILRKWFNEFGCWPIASSTPVFDVTAQIVYPAYSLDLRSDEGGNYVFMVVRRAIREKELVYVNNTYNSSYTKEFDKIRYHYFVPISEVSEATLKLAFESYTLQKEVEKMKELDKKDREYREKYHRNWQIDSIISSINCLKNTKLDSLVPAIDNLKAEVEALKK